MAEEWCREKLESLKIEESCLSTLTEIRTKLNEATHLESLITNRLLGSPEIYDCIKDDKNCENNKEKVNVVNDILEICMSNIRISQNDFPQLLQRALTHPQSQIRAVALHTILKEVQKNASTKNDYPLSDGLLKYILNALKQQEPECGLAALAILSIVLDNYIDKPEIRVLLVDMLKGDAVIKCRLYELVINLAKKSPVVLRKLTSLIDYCLSELDNDDVLMQLNVLEILYPLAEFNHGLIYLEQKQVFDVLSAKIEQIEQNPIDRLLVPGIMKFFGKIASLQPQKILNGYPYLMNCLFECFHDRNDETLPVALDTLANLARTHQGKILLDQLYGEEMAKIMNDLNNYLRNVNVDLKKRIFSCMVELFTISISEGISSQISTILEKWFVLLAGGSNVSFLFDYCRNPFPDIKTASLGFVKVLCSYNWGILALKSTGGFIEFLLDRKQEFNKEAKYVKYEIISILAESSAFDIQTNLKLRTYAKEGPFYERVQMEVAIEGN